MSQAREKPVVLLAEDEEHIARLIQYKLGRSGYEVVVARNGEEALQILDARRWALLILDVMMPIQDGWAVLRAVRNHPALRGAPVLMLSAQGQLQEMAHAADLEVQAYLKKPFELDELVACVARLVEARG